MCVSARVALYRAVCVPACARAVRACKLHKSNAKPNKSHTLRIEIELV